MNGYKNPTVRSEAIEDLDGYTARVEVEYDTDNDTTDTSPGPTVGQCTDSVDRAHRRQRGQQ